MANEPISIKEREAWNFAKSAHNGQVRKFIDLPYFDAHVQKVNGILKLYTRDETILVASLCHDVIEDCYDDKDVGYHVIRSKFGKKVASIVLELTSNEKEMRNEYDSKADYLIVKMIHMSDDALTIKLADRLQNISDAFTASDQFRKSYYKETIKIIKELKENRRFNRIQTILVNQIDAKLDNISNIFKIKRFIEI